MRSKVFISCGQATPEEQRTAADIKERLAADGFDVYVAIQAQSIEDLNSGIIGQLRRADYYIFIDFAREDVHNGQRGSLFTNQELAMACILQFEHVLFFQQAGVRPEGLLSFMGANPTAFRTQIELPDVVVAAVHQREWSRTYSRHLVVTRPRWSDTVIKFDELVGRFLYVDIENCRYDLAAYDTVARLNAINGMPCRDRSHLKATGQPGFSQIIWPRNHGAFDVLMVSALAKHQVFLNSALDVWPKPPVIDVPGTHRFEYAVLARQFPILHFTIELHLHADPMKAQAEIVATDNGA